MIHISWYNIMYYYMKGKIQLMENFSFWDPAVWGTFNLIAVLLGSLLGADVLKKVIPALKKSLIPSSVLGGLILLVISVCYESISGEIFFNIEFFGGNGSGILEILTYHCLALGFIATTLKPSDEKFGKKRTWEIFNTGVTTVSTYLLQGILGISITIIAAMISEKIFPAAGVLLPFGFGQGTGQALNYGNIYEMEFGFVGGRSFGLTIAAIGFLSASFGGVIHLNILKKKGVNYDWDRSDRDAESLNINDVQGPNEIPMNGTIDKLTMQLVFIGLAYLIAYFAMSGLGTLLSSFKSVLFGFNFLLGVLAATLIKVINNLLMKKGIVKRQHISGFLMTRLSGFFFDFMIVAGVAAIRINVLKDYWLVIIILSIVGAVTTFVYNHFIAKTLFPEYIEEQFMVMYGMLTGTASTGIVLLREIDPDLKTPASENLVYQSFPAMVFGFPLMLFATMAPEKPELVLLIMIGCFIVMNLILFRSLIFKRKKS